MRWVLFCLVVVSQWVVAVPKVKLTPVLQQGIENPLFAVTEPGNPNRLYILEQKGRVLIFEEGKPAPTVFLDIEEKVTSGGEMGLLGFAFHPDFQKNKRYFINYTTERPGLTTVVAELKAGSRDERELLSFRQPYTNHNGGHLAFGPDRLLYISAGDGGSANDPHGNGQNKGTFLGKILRIDVDHGQPYAIPKDNPFLESGARQEIFAYGLRNVWRFSFDRVTGALFGGDVGQNSWEEIDLIEKGKNYGWNTMEGTHCFKPSSGCNQAGLTLPLVEYPRSQGVSVTGGYVYRGKKIPELAGHYLYGDYGSGKIWALDYHQETKQVVKNELLLNSRLPISSFGEDANGEIFVVAYSGVLYRIDPQ